MAPPALPTPTATGIGIRAAASTSTSTVAPLTTNWTPPASCATQTPTLFAAYCSNGIQGCSTFGSTQLYGSSFDAILSMGYYTSNGMQIETACAPPSTQVGSSFWYSPAYGCPSGYKTATSWKTSSGYYSTSELAVLCCPSAYSSIAYVNTNFYRCWRYVTAAETMSVVAYGYNYGTDTLGYTTGTYLTISPISTTVVQSTRFSDGTWPTVLAEVVSMVVPATSAPTFAPTTTASSNGGYNYNNYGTSTVPFHIGPLNMIYSIVVVVVAGVVGLIVACCCCYRCCRSRPKPKPYTPYLDSTSYTPATYSSPPIAPVAGPWSTYTPQTYQTPVPAPVFNPPPPKVCPHQVAEHCRSLTSKPCCACADTRSTRMSRDVRIQTYCIFCKLFWEAIPVFLCPPEWELLGPRCAHNMDASCEGEQRDTSNSCCGCFDQRRDFLDLDFRVSEYCSSCRRLWEKKKPQEWPTIWGRPPVQIVPPKPRAPMAELPAMPRPVKPKPRPLSTRKPLPAKRDPKELSKEIELTILSHISKDQEEEGTKQGQSEENDGLQYEKPKIQVLPDGSLQNLESPPASNTPATAAPHQPVASSSTALAGNISPTPEAQAQGSNSELQYNKPRFSVPVGI